MPKESETEQNLEQNVARADSCSHFSIDKMIVGVLWVLKHVWNQRPLTQVGWLIE